MPDPNPPAETEAEKKARAARASHAARRANNALRGRAPDGSRGRAPDGSRVAFLACDAAGGQLVKVGQHDDAGHAIDCPQCGRTHKTILPRPRQRGESCDIELERPDPEAADSVDSSRAAPKSDPAVLAAIPEDWKPVTEIAEALGYTNRGSFVNRLREMRQRGAALETRQEHRTAPMFVRRIEAA